MVLERSRKPRPQGLPGSIPGPGVPNLKNNNKLVQKIE